MNRFQIDLSELAKKIIPDNDRILLKGNEDRLVHVAFDLFNLKDKNPEELWKVQSNDDGQEYIIRAFELSDQDEIVSKANWKIDFDKKAENLTVYFKNIPMTKLCAANFGAKDVKEVNLLRKTLYTRLNNDKNFAKLLINTLPKEKVAAIGDWLSEDEDNVKPLFTKKEPETKIVSTPPAVPEEYSLDSDSFSFDLPVAKPPHAKQRKSPCPLDFSPSSKRDFYDDALDRKRAIKGHFCSNCGKPAGNFDNKESEEEYYMSALCQKCQNELFQENPEDVYISNPDVKWALLEYKLCKKSADEPEEYKEYEPLSPWDEENEQERFDINDLKNLTPEEKRHLFNILKHL